MGALIAGWRLTALIRMAYASAYAIYLSTFTVPSERHVRLFRNGRNQAIRIPREFELDADEAVIHKEGGRLVIEPVRPKGLLATLATLPSLEEDFEDVDEALPPLDEPDL